MLAPARSWLATFWGPSVRYAPQHDKFGASFCTARECDRTDSSQQNSEERTHEEANCSRHAPCGRHRRRPAARVPPATRRTSARPTRPIGNGNPAAAPPRRQPAVTAALFQPAQGIFPFPNDLYFSGTTDGTINIQPANGLIPNQAGLNALDGWSTTAPIRVRFASALNPASFSAANVRVYQVTVSNTNKAVSGFTRALTFGTEYSVGLATDARRRQHDSRDHAAACRSCRPSVPLHAGDPVPDGRRAISCC